MDACQQMAVIAETTIAKEEQWIPQLRARIAARTEQIALLEYEQYCDRTALSQLLIRKEEAEADL